MPPVVRVYCVGVVSHGLVLFQKINQLITHKEKLLNQLDQFNKVQNEKFSHQLFGAPCNHKPQGGPQTYGPPTVAPAYTPANFSPEPLPYSPEPLPNYSPDVLPSQVSNNTTVDCILAALLLKQNITFHTFSLKTQLIL